MTVEVLEPHGFCAGVTNALRKALSLVQSSFSPDHSDTRPFAHSVIRLFDNSLPPVYCLHELVHNELVVADLKARGMVFVESLDEVPEGATVLFSAHGVSPAVRRQAEARRLKVVDATCPFVARVHKAARDFAARGLPVVILGHPSHAEVKGIMGEVPDPIVVPDLEAASQSLPVASGRIGVVSQTTFNADDVVEMIARLRRNHEVETMAEVCHATKERQDAVKAFDGDALLVLGSVQSSNTKRLCEVARCRTFRAGTMAEVKALDLSGIGRLGVTSGASTPEGFFTEAVSYLTDLGSRIR